MIKTISNINEFEEALKIPNVIAYFSGSNRVFDRIIDESGLRTFSKILVCNITSENLARMYEVWDSPQLLFFKNGKLGSRIKGANISESTAITLVDTYLLTEFDLDLYTVEKGD